MRAIRRAVPGGLTFRLTLILLIAAALGMTVMGRYITRALETYSTENLKSGLVKEARLVQDDITSALRKDPSRESGQALAEQYGARLNARITIIAPDGTVIGDSERTLSEVRKMENHAARPEVDGGDREADRPEHSARRRRFRSPLRCFRCKRAPARAARP